jgi:hypothetical protein
MKSGKHDIEIESGSQFDMVLTVTNDDGTDYSLAGYTANMQIRVENGTLLIDCASYIAIQNGNELNVSIPASASAGININDEAALYQIEITTGTAEYSLIRGKATFVTAVIK